MLLETDYIYDCAYRNLVPLSVGMCVCMKSGCYGILLSLLQWNSVSQIKEGEVSCLPNNISRIILLGLYTDFVGICYCKRESNSLFYKSVLLYVS